MRPAAAALASLAAAAVFATSAPPAQAAPNVAFGAYTPGAPYTRSAIDGFSDMVGRRPVIWLTYRMWGETPVATQTVRTADEAGAVTMVTWHPQNAGLRRIAGGDHDAYLRRSARDAAAWKKPVLIRFGAEMNGGWFPWGLGVGGNTADHFKSAWRHVVRVFRQEGATNVRWVWSPNVGRFDSLYPGDEWVDYLALDGYNWGPMKGGWESFDEVYADSYRAITRLSRKPLMIGEFAANETGGDKAAWIRETFSRATLERYPRIRAYVWFNTRADGANWPVDSSRASLAAFRQAIGQPYFGLSRDGFLSLAGSSEPEAPADPAPPAEERAPAPTGGRLRCVLAPRRSLRMTSDWDVTVALRCGRAPAARCRGVARLRHATRGTELGRARVDLFAGRRRPVTIGLPGWARTSLRAFTRVPARLSLHTSSGCRAGAARRITVSR